MIRKTLLIVCCVMAVTSVGLWMGSYSGGYYVSYLRTVNPARPDFLGWMFVSRPGAFKVSLSRRPVPKQFLYQTVGFEYGPHPVPFNVSVLHIRYRSVRWGATGWITYLRMPYGAPTIVFSVYPLFVFARRKQARAASRRRRGQCVDCGYDLTGNTSGVCPECGTARETKP